MSVKKLDFSYIRQSQKGFTTFLNDVVQNMTDGFALGVYCYLSSLPPEWSINKKQLMNHFKVGRDKINSVLKQLHVNHLLEYEQFRNPDGTMGKSGIIIKDGIDFIKNLPNNQQHDTAVLKSRTPANPCTGQSAPIYKTINKNKNKREKRKSNLSPGVKTDPIASSEIKIKENKKTLTKKSFCPGTKDLILTEEAINLAYRKNMDIDKTVFAFMSWYKSNGILHDDWKSAFFKWVENERNVNNSNTKESIRPKMRDFTQERLDREAKLQ